MMHSWSINHCHCPARALHALLAGKLKLNYRGFAGERRQDPERKDYLQSLTSQISPKPIPGIKEQSGTTTIASETVVVQYRPRGDYFSFQNIAISISGFT